MALFERNYRAAATAEFERSVRDLEERDKVAETKSVFQKDATDVQSNLNFAERINLVSTVQADAYRDRILKAHLAFDRMERTETRDFVDDLENPRERSARYQNMDTYNAQIAQERAKNNADTEKSESHVADKDTEERMR